MTPSWRAALISFVRKELTRKFLIRWRKLIMGPVSRRSRSSLNTKMSPLPSESLASSLSLPRHRSLTPVSLASVCSARVSARRMRRRPLTSVKLSEWFWCRYAPPRRPSSKVEPEELVGVVEAESSVRNSPSSRPMPIMDEPHADLERSSLPSEVGTMSTKSTGLSFVG